MELEHLQYVVSDHIATITLDRPETLNALTPAMRVSLLQAIDDANTSDDVRVIIITGEGRGFCSGGDVKAMNEARKAGTANVLEDRIAPIRDKIVLAMRNADKPIIAAVNGHAAGAGMNIALACDIRLASTQAKFGQTFARRGLHPDWGGTYFLPRLIGMAKACEMIWSGKSIDADEALRLGIVSDVHEPDALLPAAIDLARSFASGPPIAIRLAKRAMYRGMDTSLEEALEFETFAQNICGATEDAKEGIAAFVEKREPKFTGK
ncbi:MAG: enoyl-CoA hydratase/carnithine racemase [Candidatus Azotimanducaceae bacterium]|jgi:enoyl-CoA hydratase/carnithine racemase